MRLNHHGSDKTYFVSLPVGKSVFREPEERERGGGPKPMSAAQRIAHFWSKVKTANSDACWDWQAGKFKNGYGMYGAGRYTAPDGRFVCDVRYAHRTAYELTKGEIPPGLHVMHACDNRACCNPAHLSVGTANDNVQDAIRKRRFQASRRSAA